jgi:hypothetical protein
MQLPLSASALVMLGVGAVLVGASILAVVAVRRRKPAPRPTRMPPDMRRVQPPPAAASGPHAAAPAIDNPAARPHLPTSPAAPTQMESGSASADQATEYPAPPPPEPVAGPVAAAATPRPMEVVAKVEPPDRTPPAWSPAAPRHPQAGSGRTVAAAVAQAFAVRAAAGRGGVSGPGVQQPPAPPSDDSATTVQESEPAQPDPHHVPASDADGGDPAATTDPDGRGPAAMAAQDSGFEPRAAEAEGPEAAASGNGWAATAAYGTNGDHAPDGNGQSPAADPGSAGHGPAAAGAGLARWTAPAAPVQPDPEPAAVPAPRPDNGSVAQQDGPVSDARDRLLAVLLDDPERAVGAAVELETCLRELDRLSDAVRTSRVALRDVLHRLAAAGLRPDQLARLAKLPQAEVEELLEVTPAEQQA